MGAIFLFVGVIEVLSIAVRPVALMFRLYGNVYAGGEYLGDHVGHECARGLKVASSPPLLLP